MECALGNFIITETLIYIKLAIPSVFGLSMAFYSTCLLHNNNNNNNNNYYYYYYYYYIYIIVRVTIILIDKLKYQSYPYLVFDGSKYLSVYLCIIYISSQPALAI